MKHRYSKERKILWMEFVYMHREEITKLQQEWDKLTFNSRPESIDKFVNEKIRPHMGFSVKTANVDIFLSCQRFLAKLLATRDLQT